MGVVDSRQLADSIVERLRASGHRAFLVGGCVRDLLLGRVPKDFDVASSAPPAELLRLFPRAGQVGAHFGVVLVREDGAQVEVATFRSDLEYTDGRHPEGVRFEDDPRQDALRRDFTINALLLDPATGEVIDFIGGRADLAAGIHHRAGDFRGDPQSGPAHSCGFGGARARRDRAHSDGRRRAPRAGTAG